MKTITLESGITKVYGNVEVSKILSANDNTKKGVHKAQLKQEVTTTYPASRVNTSLFDMTEFDGVGQGQSYKSVRTTLIDVPQSKTMEQVQSKVDQAKEAVLWKRISTSVKDVLTEEQIYAIDNGLQTLSFFEDKFLIRTADGNQPSRNGDLVTEYQQHFFSSVYKEDEDFRGVVASNSDFELKGSQPASKLTNLSNLVQNGQAKF